MTFLEKPNALICNNNTLLDLIAVEASKVQYKGMNDIVLETNYEDKLQDIPFGIQSLKRIPAFIMISAFICGRNPESSDKKIFKGGI